MGCKAIYVGVTDLGIHLLLPFTHIQERSVGPLVVPTSLTVGVVSGSDGLSVTYLFGSFLLLGIAALCGS